VIKAFCSENGIDFTIFRLTPVYGKDFLRNLHKRIYLPGKIAFYKIGPGEQRLSICSVNNIIEAICESLSNKKFKNEIFILKDERNYPINELIATFNELFHNGKHPVINIPHYLPVLIFKILSIVCKSKADNLIFNLTKITNPSSIKQQSLQIADLSQAGICGIPCCLKQNRPCLKSAAMAVFELY